MKIIPTIVTTSDWKVKMKEAKELKEVCLFLTVVDFQERKKIYQELEKTDIKSIPFVHLRNDIKAEEIDFLIKKYNTEVFNTHSQKEFPFVYDISKYKNKIYIENVHYKIDEKEIKEFAGICLDFAHLENDRIFKKEKFDHDIKLIKKYPIGCSHISCIKKEKRKDKEIFRHDFHHFEDLSEFDYLKKYSSLFAPFNALELENSIEEQLKAKKYIHEILSKRV